MYNLKTAIIINKEVKDYEQTRNYGVVKYRRK